MKLLKTLIVIGIIVIFGGGICFNLEQYFEHAANSSNSSWIMHVIAPIMVLILAIPALIYHYLQLPKDLIHIAVLTFPMIIGYILVNRFDNRINRSEMTSENAAIAPRDDDCERHDSETYSSYSHNIDSEEETKTEQTPNDEDNIEEKDKENEKDKSEINFSIRIVDEDGKPYYLQGVNAWEKGSLLSFPEHDSGFTDHDGWVSFSFYSWKGYVDVIVSIGSEELGEYQFYDGDTTSFTYT